MQWPTASHSVSGAKLCPSWWAARGPRGGRFHQEGTPAVHLLLGELVIKVARRKNKQFGPMTVQLVVTEGATTYLLHDLQRGHAQDLAERGSTLRVILEAGEWRSSAFACYRMEAQWADGSSEEAGAP